MKLTAASLNNPAAAIVAVTIIVIFGIASLSRLPIQLFPDIENPRIAIQTGWRAASPRARSWRAASRWLRSSRCGSSGNSAASCSRRRSPAIASRDSVARS